MNPSSFFTLPTEFVSSVINSVGETLLSEQLILFFVSLAANTLSAIAGGGAGLLQLPAIIFLGLPFSLALSTHKIASVALGIGATVKHAKNKVVQVKFCIYILLTGLPGVFIGAKTILSIPDHIAKVALGILTLGMGIYSLTNKELGKDQSVSRRSNGQWIIGGLVLLFLGFLNGSLTSGTGLFVTFWLVKWFGLDFKTAIAYTMILVGLFWNATGAIILALQVPPKWEWLPALLAASIIGGYLGAHLAVKYGNSVIKKLFEVITVLVGVSLIVHGMN